MQFFEIFIYTFYIIQQRKLLQLQVVEFHNSKVVVSFNKSIFDIEHFYVLYKLYLNNPKWETF